MKIGILGGTFNPVHIGHLILAEEARVHLKLDKVIFVPCYLPPHKSSKGVIAAPHRLNMLERAVAAHPDFYVSDIETKAKVKSYTFSTLEKLREVYAYPVKLFLIVGSDALEELPHWKNFGRIARLAEVVVAERPEFPVKRRPSWARIIQVTRVGISSSDVRDRIKKGLPIRYLVPEKVESYIVKNRLYAK